MAENKNPGSKKMRRKELRQGKHYARQASEVPARQPRISPPKPGNATSAGRHGAPRKGDYLDPRLRGYDVGQVAKVIGVPAAEWPGRCHEIALLMQKHDLLPKNARVVYGMWLGPIADNSKFAGRPFTHHGWVICKDGSVIDPTRFAFEGVEPYVYEGPSGQEYDEAGMRFATRFRGPAPEYNPDQKQFKLPMEHMQLTALGCLLDLARGEGKPEQLRVTWCLDQLVWLGNTPPNLLGDLAEPLYEALKEIGMIAVVPIDFRKHVEQAVC